MNYAKHALACGVLWSMAAGHAAAAEPKLEIRKFQLTYDAFGPVRDDASYYPGESLCCRYDVHGCGENEAGRMELEVTCQLTDANGKVRSAFSNTIKEDSWKNSPGCARAWSLHAFAGDCRPGRYQFELLVEDKLGGGEARLTQELTIKPTALALVSPRFFYDARRQCPAPLSGFLEQTLYLDVDVIGEDRTQGKAALAYSLEILDAAGSNVLRNVAPQESQIDDAAFIQDRNRRPVIHWTVTLKQAGRYKLRLTLVDQMAGNQARLELPLEVLDPSEPGTVAAN